MNIKIYSKTGCSYCVKAKEWFTTNALDFIDAEKLIKTTKESWNNIGQIKIEKENTINNISKLIL